MAAGDLITQPWQWEFAGLLMGDGTLYDVTGVTGVDLPPIRPSDAPRTRDHGSFAGIDLLGERAIVMDIEFAAPDATTLASSVAAFAAVTVPPLLSVGASGEQPLVWQLPGQTKRQAGVRARRRALPLDQPYTVGYAKAVVEFVATDPRVYDQALQSLSTGQPVMTGGLGFPLGPFPVGFGSAGSGGVIFAANTGNFAGRPVLVIAGPCGNPVVENRTAGQTLSFSITLAAGDTLTVDLDARSVLLNGTASRRNALVSTPDQWWDLAAATTSEIHFRTSDGANTGATLTMNFRPSWL